MDLSKWKYILEFGNGLYIYAKGKERVGVDKAGNVIIAYRGNCRDGEKWPNTCVGSDGT